MWIKTSQGEIYDSILPPEFPRHYSFETVGHIAHLNLKPEYNDYKELIGEVIISVSEQHCVLWRPVYIHS